MLPGLLTGQVDFQQILSGGLPLEHTSTPNAVTKPNLGPYSVFHCSVDLQFVSRKLCGIFVANLACETQFWMHTVCKAPPKCSADLFCFHTRLSGLVAGRT